MMHRNAQTLGDAIREFFEDNAELRGKILEIRVMRAWGEILGPMVAQYTRNICKRQSAVCFPHFFRLEK